MDRLLKASHQPCGILSVSSPLNDFDRASRHITVHPEHTGTTSSLSLVCLWLSLKPRIILLTCCSDRSGTKRGWTNSFSSGVLLRHQSWRLFSSFTLLPLPRRALSTCIRLIFSRITSHSSHRHRGKNKFALLWVVWVGRSRVQWNIFCTAEQAQKFDLYLPWF